MRCAVMTWGLFEVNDAYEQNEVSLTKDMTQFKNDLKVQTDKVKELNKQLSQMNKQKKDLRVPIIKNEEAKGDC